MSRLGKPLLELRRVSRHFKNGDTIIKAMDSIDLTIRHGEFVSIMGQSGSGKSTLMNIIGCLDRATSGEYYIDGILVNDLKPNKLARLRRDTFGFVFQRYNLLSGETASENVQVPAMYAGLSKAERRTRAEELLTRLGMGDRLEHYPSQLSGGQQQRVAIARALVNHPFVILADEPTGALDSKSGDEVLALLKKLHREEGATIVMITHEEHIANQAERIVRIHDGKIVEDRSAKPVLADGREHVRISKKEPSTSVMLGNAVHTALRSLKANLFRTALTLLGIVIGVASVVTMLAIGTGSKQDVIDQIQKMGTNLTMVFSGAPGVRGSGSTLSIDDVNVLKTVDDIVYVVPERSGSTTVRYGNIDYRTSLQGVGYQYAQPRDWELDSGTFFTQEDERSYAPVVVLGKSVRDYLFSDTANPVGQYIQVGSIPMQVIGVMQEKGAAMFGRDQDDMVLTPYTTAMMRVLGGTYLSMITVKNVENTDIDTLQENMKQALMVTHKTEDFRIRSSTSLISMVSDTQNTLTILLGAVAAISLFVGGIGVMNIMLVSVTERTREIGVRMATGARMRDILIQFNTEAAVVCAIGGVLGLGLGFLTGWIISLFEVSIVFTLMPSVLAFGCAFITGILFGYLPARKAAKLDPVVALATE